jgi:hypothetical protein
MRSASVTCVATLLLAGAGVALPLVQVVETQVATPPASAAHTYVVPGKPSDVVQNHEAMLSLARQVETNVKADLETPGNRDNTALTRGYSSLQGIALLKHDYLAARRYLALVRELQVNPIGRLLTGVITEPYMQAMEEPGTDFHVAFRACLSRRLAALPFDDVQATLSATKTSLESASKEQVIRGLAAGVDPLVKDGQLSQEMAEGLVSAAMNLEVILTVKDDVVACIESLFSADKSRRTTADGAAKVARTVLGTIETPPRGTYFGQALPGDTPVLFAPELRAKISPWVEGFVFSPDGTQCLMGVGDASYSSSALYLSTRVSGVWAPFVEAPFTSGFEYSGGPGFSPDGRMLTFSGKKATGSQDLWAVTYTGHQWGAPVALPSPVNTDDREFPVSTTASGTVYFSRAHSGLASQLYTARQDGSRKWVVELLGAPINAQSYEGDPSVAADGHFLVFYSARVGSHGGTDLYVSFSDGRGGWKTPINLGAAFNSPDDEYGAHLSSDGKYLFFTRHTVQGNGIYWVAVSAIEKLKDR